MSWFGAGEEVCGHRVRKKCRLRPLPSMRHQKVLLRKVLSQLRSKGWGGQAQRPGRCKGASGGGTHMCQGLEPWKSQTHLKNWTVFRMAGAQKMKWLILKVVTLYKRRTGEATSAKTWEEQRDLAQTVQGWSSNYPVPRTGKQPFYFRKLINQTKVVVIMLFFWQFQARTIQLSHDENTVLPSGPHCQVHKSMYPCIFRAL